MPFVKKWSEDDNFRPRYYLSSSSRVTRARDTDYMIALAFEDLRSREPERFEKEFPRLYPFICGCNGTDLGAVDMIVKRIKEFPGTWKGIGEVMSRHDDLVEILDQSVLKNHSSHVSIDLSWVVFENYLTKRDESGIITADRDGDPEIRPEWVQLIEKYPENFILGSDKVGDFTKYRDEIRKYNALLKVLSPETRILVANGNFKRVMPKEGITLPSDYFYPEPRFTKRMPPMRD